MPYKLNSFFWVSLIFTLIESAFFLNIQSTQQFQSFPLIPKQHVKQNLTIEHSNFSGLVISFESISAQVTSLTSIQLTSNDQIIAQTTILPVQLRENPLITLHFPPQEESLGETYVLAINFTDQITPPALDQNGFFIIPQYQVQMWDKLTLLTQRIQFIHGNTSPPFLVYGLLVSVLWTSNMFLLAALKHVQTEILRL